MSYLIGIDLGGTKILAALFDEHGKMIQKKRLLTQPERGPDAIIKDMAYEVQVLLEGRGIKRKELKGVGVSIAGFYDVSTGIMRSSPNLPGWEMYPVRRELTKLLDCPVLVDNDASAAAYGEYLVGAGQGVRHLVHITLGTGIGGGLILDGRVYRGSRGFAGELGHIQLLPGGPLCGCGRQGCFEALVSGTAVAREGKMLLEAGRAAVLQQLVSEDKTVTAGHVFQAAARGDSDAQSVVKRAAFYLGQGLAIVTNLINPERITLGGGLSRVENNFIEEAESYLREAAVDVSSEAVELVRAELIDEAGVFGIIALLNERLRD